MESSVVLTFWAVIGLSITTAIFHTITGPDHYVPFIVLAKARKWTLRKTLALTFISGLGHIASAFFLALLFNCFENKLALWNQNTLDETRGSLAAWLLTSLGFICMVWGIIRAYREHHHTHAHIHENGIVHIHGHEHASEHAHIHGDKNHRFLLGWSLFIIFVLGPCEAMLPIIAAAATVGTLCLFAATFLFSVTTILSMLTAVTLGYYGAHLINIPWLERFSHALAGLIIMLCGLGMIFLGL